jgi:hypothetical protein
MCCWFRCWLCGYRWLLDSVLLLFAVVGYARHRQILSSDKAVSMDSVHLGLLETLLDGGKEKRLHVEPRRPSLHVDWQSAGAPIGRGTHAPA